MQSRHLEQIEYHPAVQLNVPSAKAQAASPRDKGQSAHLSLQSDRIQPMSPHPPQSTYPGPKIWIRPTAPAISHPPKSMQVAALPADSQSRRATHPNRAEAAPLPATA